MSKQTYCLKQQNYEVLSWATGARAVASATALNDVLEWPIGRLLGGVAGPARRTGKCFCLSLSSSSGSWSREEQCSSVLINFWCASSSLPSYCAASPSLLLFTDLFPGGFPMVMVWRFQSLMNAIGTKGPACDRCTVPPLTAPLTLFVVFCALLNSSALGESSREKKRMWGGGLETAWTSLTVSYCTSPSVKHLHYKPL